jgi:hypothetical protein
MHLFYASISWWDNKLALLHTLQASMSGQAAQFRCSS